MCYRKRRLQLKRRVDVLRHGEKMNVPEEFRNFTVKVYFNVV